MADYWISYHINYDNESSYNKRYNALVKAIGEVATGGQWDTDTSFVAVRSKYGIATAGKHLKEALNTSTDHLVMREIGKASTRYINDPGEGFDAFFPEAIKL